MKILSSQLITDVIMQESQLLGDNDTVPTYYQLHSNVRVNS